MTRPRSRKSLSERFWAKVQRADGCWLWTAGTDGKGYGKIGMGGRGDPSERAHRVSWMLHNGEIPDGLCVLHRCDVPACVNPSHLFLGTRTDNANDKTLKGRAGAPTWDKIKATKLTPALAQQISDYAKRGYAARNIAQQFGITSQTVRDITSGRNWSHATGIPKASRGRYAKSL